MDFPLTAYDLTATEQELLRFYRSLSPESRQKLSDKIDSLLESRDPNENAESHLKSKSPTPGSGRI